MPTPVIREYSKKELRAIYSNPNIDTTQNNWVLQCRLKRKQDFNKAIYPIIETHCRNLISLEEFKRKKIVPAKVVSIIISNLTT